MDRGAGKGVTQIPQQIAKEGLVGDSRVWIRGRNGCAKDSKKDFTQSGGLWYSFSSRIVTPLFQLFAGEEAIETSLRSSAGRR